MKTSCLPKAVNRINMFRNTTRLVKTIPRGSTTAVRAKRSDSIKENKIAQTSKNNFILSKTWADVSAQYAFSVSGSAKKSRSDQSSINLGKFVAAELETKAAAKPDPGLALDLEVKLIADVSVECPNMVAITQLKKKGSPESFKRNRIEIRKSRARMFLANFCYDVLVGVCKLVSLNTNKTFYYFYGAKDENDGFDCF